jgi:hypothetical protein
MSRPATTDRSLYLVATDVAGRTSVLAGPYATLSEAAGRVPDVARRLSASAALTAFGHVTVAEGAANAATLFGRA